MDEQMPFRLYTVSDSKEPIRATGGLRILMDVLGYSLEEIAAIVQSTVPAMKGKAEVQTYFHNYSGKSDWLLVPGFVEQRPAILVCDPARPSDAPLYFVLLQWEEGALAYVRDFRYARYATEGAEMQRLWVAAASLALLGPRGVRVEDGRVRMHDSRRASGCKFGVRILVNTDRRRGPSLGESQNGFLIPKRHLECRRSASAGASATWLAHTHELHRQHSMRSRSAD